MNLGGLMLDFSKSPNITVSFSKATAAPVKQGKLVSHGKKTSRMHLIKGTDICSVAVHSPFSSTPLKLNLFERINKIVVKVKNEEGEVGYVKVNSNSLRKRLGFSDKEFKEIKKSGSSERVLEQIKNLKLFYNEEVEMIRPKTSTKPEKPKYEGKYAYGSGTLTWPSGAKYEGEYFEGKPHGLGTYSWADGSKYVGEFKEGKRHGQGTYKYADGTLYKGEFKDDMRHGKGTSTFPDGASYVGEYQNDKRHGQGTYTSPDSSYKGEYKDGLRHGQGTSTYKDGSSYVGEYQNDMRHGKGTVTSSKRISRVRNYKEGKLVQLKGATSLPQRLPHMGKPMKIFPDGAVYKGEMKDGKARGKGTLTFPSGAKYEGEFKNDKFHGRGTYTYPDGTHSKVEFKEGKIVEQDESII